MLRVRVRLVGSEFNVISEWINDRLFKSIRVYILEASFFFFSQSPRTETSLVPASSFTIPARKRNKTGRTSRRRRNLSELFTGSSWNYDKTAFFAVHEKRDKQRGLYRRQY